jgi:hypothetical protein
VPYRRLNSFTPGLVSATERVSAARRHHQAERFGAGVNSGHRFVATEAFDTADLKDAKALLDGLNA